MVLFTLTVFLGTRQGAFAQTFGPGVIATNDLTQSLGQFSIIVNPTFQGMMVGYPTALYNSTTHVFTSPVLYDQTTIVGRSAPLQAGSTGDLNGVPVGVAGVIISNAMMVVQPAGLEPAGTREVHTMIYSLNMTDGNGSAVRAGTNATVLPPGDISAGEVESLSGPTGLPANDFPARSFFDVFVDVDIPAGGTFPGATNLFNTLPLLVQNTNLASFPPTVVYMHGMSTAVPVKFGSGPFAGQIFGLLTLAGHGVASGAQMLRLPSLERHYGRLEVSWVGGRALGPVQTIGRVALERGGEREIKSLNILDNGRVAAAGILEIEHPIAIREALMAAALEADAQARSRIGPGAPGGGNTVAEIITARGCRARQAKGYRWAGRCR